MSQPKDFGEGGWQISKEVAASEASLRRLQDIEEALNAHAGVVATDGRGRIVDVNSRFTEMCGFAPEELVGQTMRLLHSGLHGREYYKGLWQTLRMGRTWKGEFCNRAKDGRLYWVSATIVPYLSGPGEAERFVAIEEDITEYKATKEALLQVQHLEQMGLMASGMAHDFNNLMQSLLYGLDGLHASSIDAAARMEALREVAEQCQSLAARLLRIGKGPSAAPQWADLNALLRKLLPILGQVLRGSHRLELELSPILPCLWIDPLQAQQVVLNLVGNARDAMKGGGTVRIRTALCTLSEKQAGSLSLPAGEYVGLDVEDEGLGIPPDLLPRVMEPFFSTKTSQGGTGLGLTVTQMILRSHGGALSCESEPGRGARMRTLWPLAVGAGE